ncbi:CbtB domain-containing protein [Streptomyces sp. NPDC006798]|uniref:CbtB domain-containing protein n=1 Tax=Streptomyces sp. NPDC006798 TaxID=3155462 RepID=UPI00340E8966
MAQSAVPAAPLTPAPARTPVAVAPLSLREIAPWALFTGILALILLYFVGAEQGAVALVSGESVHEWVHDGRHLLGFPCH